MPTQIIRKSVKHIARSIARRSLSEQSRHNIIRSLAKGLGVDLLQAAYADMGILQYQNNRVSGEEYVLSCFLPTRLKTQHPIIFDVGANIGNYALAVKRNFPNAFIYTFEPNPNTFQDLCEKFKDSDVRCVNVGFSSQAETTKIYTYESDHASSHASLFKEVLTDLHHNTDLVEISMNLITLDDYCSANSIPVIDFLKIDTEGNELEVLRGAEQMLGRKRIDVIQFEFNEMNTISRVFLRDFYQLLPDFDFYRLHEAGLIPLAQYSPQNEIFQFHNILAVNRDSKTSEAINLREAGQKCR